MQLFLLCPRNVICLINEKLAVFVITFERISTDNFMVYDLSAQVIKINEN